MIGNSVKLAGDGFLELAEERLKSLIKTVPITDVYHVEQTPFARGKFASVRKLVHHSTGVAFAGKFIRRRRCRGASIASNGGSDVNRDIAHEMAVLELCADSRRVVLLKEVYETRSEVVLVLELATGGELQHLLDADERLHECDARRALRDTLLGLRDLHRHNVAHLDLKPQNLLLCKSENSTSLGEVKLCDFGISRLIQPGVEVREIMGTPDYVAPEVLQYERLSLATDIWSIGVLAYVLLSGFSPFAGESKQETFLNISQAELTFPEELFENVSETAMDFVKSCLIIHPGSRPTVDQCLEHPWLSESTLKVLETSNLTENTTEEKAITNGTHKTENNTEDATEKQEIKTNGTTPNSNEKSDGDTLDKKQISIKSDLLSKSAVFISFPDAPTTPKVSRKSHPQSNTVLSLCKKFQTDVVDCKKSDVDLALKERDLNGDVNDLLPKENEQDNFSNFENSVAYTMTCLLCSQCGGNCCHIPRKSLSMERGIIC